MRCVAMFSVAVLFLLVASVSAPDLAAQTQTLRPVTVGSPMPDITGGRGHPVGTSGEERHDGLSPWTVEAG